MTTDRTKEPPDHSWVEMETIKGPPNPWAAFAFGLCLIFAVLAIALLLS